MYIVYIARIHVRETTDTIKLSIKCCDGDDDDDDFDTKIQNSFQVIYWRQRETKRYTHFMKTYEIRCIWCRGAEYGKVANENAMSIYLRIFHFPVHFEFRSNDNSLNETIKLIRILSSVDCGLMDGSNTKSQLIIILFCEKQSVKRANYVDKIMSPSFHGW